MKTKTLYCTQCKNNYNVRKEDLELMLKHHSDFDGKEYLKGCFFKDLNTIKRAQINSNKPTIQK